MTVSRTLQFAVVVAALPSAVFVAELRVAPFAAAPPFAAVVAAPRAPPFVSVAAAPVTVSRALAPAPRDAVAARSVARCRRRSDGYAARRRSCLVVSRTLGRVGEWLC